MRIPSFVLIFVLSMLAWARPAYAETFNTCTGFITSVPAVISTQGTWCLKQDLATAITSGHAITISTNNVTIDCNDFKLGGQGAGLGTFAIGIFAQDRLNATVRHCPVRGFLRGLLFAGGSSGGHVVEDNSFDGNTFVGLQVYGDGSVVRRNRVFDTGASSVGTSAVGIFGFGFVDILDNTVSGVVARSGGGGGAIGIETISNASGRIIGDGVRGLLKDGNGVAYGIFNSGSGRISLRNNDIVGDSSAFSVGLYCGDATGRAKDNVIGGFATAIDTCGDAGENDITP